MAQSTAVADAEVADAQALVRAQDAARAVMAAQVVALSTNAARDFAGWYDSQAITGWAATLARQVESVQRTLARSTDAYLARFASQMTGKRVRPVGAVDVTTLRREVTHAGAYARAADAYRYQQSLLDRSAVTVARVAEPSPPDLVSPIDAAVARVQSVADADMQLVVREQSRKVMESHREIIGWRRVIHPELSAGGTCGLCVAASDRLYGPTQPLAIHQRCNCVPLPVYDRKDVAAELNRVDLAQVYQDAGGTTDAASLKRTRYAVTEHGELGPVLHSFDQPLRTRGDVKRDTSKPRRPKSPSEQRANVEQILASLEPAVPKARALAEADPKKWGDYEKRLLKRVADLRDQLH